MTKRDLKLSETFFYVLTPYLKQIVKEYSNITKYSPLDINTLNIEKIDNFMSPFVKSISISETPATHLFKKTSQQASYCDFNF